MWWDTASSVLCVRRCASCFPFCLRYLCFTAGAAALFLPSPLHPTHPSHLPTPPNPQVRQLFFHDPDDNMIEICNCDCLPVVPLDPTMEGGISVSCSARSYFSCGRGPAEQQAAGGRRLRCAGGGGRGGHRDGAGMEGESGFPCRDSFESDGESMTPMAADLLLRERALLP